MFVRDAAWAVGGLLGTLPGTAMGMGTDLLTGTEVGCVHASEGHVAAALVVGALGGVPGLGAGGVGMASVVGLATESGVTMHEIGDMLGTGRRAGD